MRLSLYTDPQRDCQGPCAVSRSNRGRQGNARLHFARRSPEYTGESSPDLCYVMVSDPPSGDLPSVKIRRQEALHLVGETAESIGAFQFYSVESYSY